MIRTTITKVIKVLGDDYGKLRNRDDPDMDTYIETANAMVDDLALCADAKGLPLTAERLELIERWLAAHSYKQSDKDYIARSTASASGTFAGKTEMYLESTLYGQTAVNLDTSGCLSTVAGGARKVATLDWGGKPPSDQIPYHQRD